jgi:hypothetical protein
MALTSHVRLTPLSQRDDLGLNWIFYDLGLDHGLVILTMKTKIHDVSIVCLSFMFGIRR